MSRSQRARWRHAVIWAAAGAVLLLVAGALGHFLVGAVGLLVSLVGAWVASPLRADPSLTHWDAQQRHVRDGAIVVYWRPGSLGCLRLRSSLRSVSDQILWVNVWADDEAAAFVRDVNGGAEIVPTAILRNGDALCHPSPDAVRADLQDRAA
ncbi:hypothetical protein [Austwickia sp. TVS 96-490-7B]|uniref:hypothetical protein n=1 Tax=Austwickia sp. TVS 96-490-7B TaxID=2830843 RepID=UPI001C579BB0|nr:hypothetical protein [Austwickia sp. TVS 96-490-7B]